MAWSHIQSAGTVATSITTLSKAYASNLSSGSKLIVITCPFKQTTTSVKDAANNSFTKIAAIGLDNSTASFGELSVWALDTPAGDVGSAPTITATYSASTPGSTIVIQEVSGLAAGNTVGLMCDGSPVTNFGSSTSNFSATCGSYSSTALNEYLLAVYGDSQPSTATAATPTGSTTYTRDAASQQTNGVTASVPAYGNSTNGAETASFSVTGVSGTDAWATIMVAFKLPAIAVAPPPLTVLQAVNRGVTW